ncbi:hypothetical protein QUF54_02045 [Candidatus Marithioploca araucensis]|uniref:Ig-like domain-containing protein n=1 Tax=Candidatus Marithioploca araucensis TaxID=70273 RepID=A0ABT7VRG4_9GAMM|nr:hypothetical protein [Candidatus Marithioploca araucensis]
MNHPTTFLQTTSYVVLSLLFIPFGFAAPVNDNLANAIEVTKLPFTHQQNTQEATKESSEATPSCTDSSGASVWYKYTPTSNQVVLFDTVDSNYDTVLSVWSGKPFTMVECNDDEGTGEKYSQLSVALQKKTTYYINISGYNGDTGKLLFNATPVNPLVNDNLADAIEITGEFFYNVQDTKNAMSEEVTASCAPNGTSVWYQYTPSIDQKVILDTLGSNYDTALSIWTDHPLTEIACNDDEGIRDTQQSEIGETLTAGTTYYIRVTGEMDNEEASETRLLVFHATFLPENDDIANAIQIKLPYTSTQNTTYATLESSEAISKCGLQESTSVWYEYTPSTKQQVSFSTKGSDYDTVLSIWTGKADSLTEWGCNDDAITTDEEEQTSQTSLPLKAKKTYFIKVSGPADKTGNLALQVEQVVNDIKITEQPTDQTIGTGEKATLTVEVSGTEPFSYQWYQGESGDVSTARVNIKTFTTPPLMETTRYWVRITNPTGTIDSQTAIITLKDKTTNGVGVDAENNEIATQANFAGFITSSEKSVEVVSQTDTVSITFTITIDPNHVGQQADIIMLGNYTANNATQFYMRESQVRWKIWDGKIPHLVAAQADIQLPKTLKVTVFEGTLRGKAGQFTIYVGYRLQTGEIFYNGEPISFTVE